MAGIIIARAVPESLILLVPNAQVACQFLMILAFAYLEKEEHPALALQVK